MKGIITGIILVILLVVLSSDLIAAEKDYQLKYCKGKIEHVLPDRTRVDCLTETHAIEYDYGHKWAEAIGQSLHYAMYTGKRAGVVLIVSPTEHRFVTRIKAVIDHYPLPISVWTVPK